MAYIAMAYVVVVDRVMAYVVMACIVMAYIVMSEAFGSEGTRQGGAITTGNECRRVFSHVFRHECKYMQKECDKKLSYVQT